MVPLRPTPSPVFATASARSGPPPSVCFVAPHAYGALTAGEEVAHIGGAERQQVLIAHELVRRGYRVSFVTLDHGQGDGYEIGGIRVLGCYRADAGIPKLRFLHPRLTGLWAAMARAAADVYYQRGASAETGLVARWCCGHARRFVFGIAHDTNCLRVSPLPRTRAERALFRYGLRRAGLVIAQTRQQQRLLRDQFGIAAPVVPSICPWGPDATPDAGADPRSATVLWVGRLMEEKRPDWLVRLARDLPRQCFDVVGQSNADSAYGRRVAARLRSLPNVRWHGYVSHARMRALYRAAGVVLCTSDSEGFPNVFLEAWSCGRPVLTTVDPDEVVATFQLGHVAPDYTMLRDHLASLESRRAMWEAAGARGIDYVRQNHGIRAVGDAIDAALRRSVETPLPAPARHPKLAKEGR
jgi:glycosyltransferase involved in cell wall biosynthesis